MSSITIAVLEWMLILLGHIAIACVLFNHVHAKSSPRFVGKQSRKITEKLIAAFAIVPVFTFFVWMIPQAGGPHKIPTAIAYYLVFAAIVGTYFSLRWIYRTLTRKLPLGAIPIETETFDVQKDVRVPLLHRAKGKLLRFFPGNQVTKISIQQWEFRFKQLPADLDGIKICQLSDLHFTGLIGREYFEKVVEYANDLKADIIVITGDLIDSDECLDWIDGTLGKLTARKGVYYILGNHDRLIRDYADYRQRLANAGLIAAAGTWHSIQFGNAKLLLTGNELPWFNETNELPPRPEIAGEVFSLLLSHSPDQIGWAVQRGFDMMFAGHTHGGQIRLPIVGPIVAPSKYGIKYASGTFQIRNTMMHVSRGISGDEPIRINCPPELGCFTLRKA